MVYTKMAVTHNYYDSERGWKGTNPGWHQVDIYTVSPSKHLEMVQWIYDNIDNPERHARWIFENHANSSFKFRYERDFVWFRLTW